MQESTINKGGFKYDFSRLGGLGGLNQNADNADTLGGAGLGLIC